MNTAAALANAKHRLSYGWPLVLVLLALYGPVTGITQLVVLGAGLYCLSRGAPGTQPKPAPAKPSKPAARPRDDDGKWTK